ncbi:transcriptional regulator [Nocardia mangyaensis]|uniref:transcriptional regulator n=1 Tax=Nocardia mangyaensis TaxID=2213200 RepID=UPI002675A3DA|nr:transcriptional regulator [Nocardia mangyaensis]MDO3650372.1 transcriptional regulator [Nocardia mangyaensis]
MNADQEQFVNAMGDTLANLEPPARDRAGLRISAPARRPVHLGPTPRRPFTQLRHRQHRDPRTGLLEPDPHHPARRQPPLLVEATGGFEQLLAASHERTRVFVRKLLSAERLTDTPHAPNVTDLFTTYVDAGERVVRERAQAQKDD